MAPVAGTDASRAVPAVEVARFRHHALCVLGLAGSGKLALVPFVAVAVGLSTTLRVQVAKADRPSVRGLVTAVADRVRFGDEMSFLKHTMEDT